MGSAYPSPHGGVAAALLSRAPSDFGATDLVTAAISVNIVPAHILQAGCGLPSFTDFAETVASASTLR